jgi:hypothetical protein
MGAERPRFPAPALRAHPATISIKAIRHCASQNDRQRDYDKINTQPSPELADQLEAPVPNSQYTWATSLVIEQEPDYLLLVTDAPDGEPSRVHIFSRGRRVDSPTHPRTVSPPNGCLMMQGVRLPAGSHRDQLGSLVGSLTLARSVNVLCSAVSSLWAVEDLNL